MPEEERLMAELYDKLSSEFYDYQFNNDSNKRGDVKFYVDFAIESGGPVLELGCGTGRILFPTARTGVSITGLDRSEEMLKICRQKIEKEPPKVKSRIQLVYGDMRQFDLQSQFSLVTITFGPFNNLIAVEEQMNCLECIHRHLQDGGSLVFDVYYINLKELTASPGTDIAAIKTPFKMPDGRQVTWGVRRRAPIDFGQQILYDGLFYNIRYPDGCEEQIAYPEASRYFYRFEVEHLLARSGFRTEAVYADFNKAPFGSKYPSEMIFVAGKQ